MNPAQKHTEIRFPEPTTRAAHRLTSIINLIQKGSAPQPFVKRELLTASVNAIPPSRDHLYQSTEWFEFGKVFDPVGFQIGTLLAASRGYKFVASFDSEGYLASLITLDHSDRQGVVMDRDGGVRSFISLNARRSNAYFIHPKHGPIGDVSQDFTDGHMTVRKVGTDLEGFIAIRIGQNILFRQAGHQLGSVQLSGRISPADCIAAAWFALTDAEEDPRVF